MIAAPLHYKIPEYCHSILIVVISVVKELSGGAAFAVEMIEIIAGNVNCYHQQNCKSSQRLRENNF